MTSIMERDLVIPDTREPVAVTPASAPRGAGRERLRDLLWLLPVLLGGVIVNAINLGGSPQRIDDEGTYTAQAWSIAHLGELTHYTYWYDHPPLGWIQIAAYAGLTGAWDRYDVAVIAAREGMALGKFVIANPFGPYEELRFTRYLMNCWREGRTARVNTPDYVRDNIPVSLMALAYADFTAALPDSGFHKFNPSYYAESQGAFAVRFAREVGGRLNMAAPLELVTQTDFSEPLVRINTDRIVIDPARWRESAAWDDVAGYYRATFAAAA